MRPPCSWCSPKCISPPRNVPVVSTTAEAVKLTPRRVWTPPIRPESISKFVTVSCHISRLGSLSNSSRQASIQRIRSLCALGLHIAGPLLRLSIRNWIAVLSVIKPIRPPKASISRTICPLAIPPTAGLQLICAILFISLVIRRVFEPKRAAAAAASQPAWPAPIIIISYFCISFFNSFTKIRNLNP